MGVGDRWELIGRATTGAAAMMGAGSGDDGPAWTIGGIESLLGFEGAGGTIIGCWVM